MKKTVTYFPSFWVKVFPVVLMFLSIGITRAHAQNYKPLDEATTSVLNALDVLKAQGGVKSVVTKGTGNGQATTSSLTPAQSSNSNLTTFEIAYYEAFLEKVKSAQDVAQGVQALDAAINAQGQPQSRVATLNAGRANLISLITN